MTIPRWSNSGPNQYDYAITGINPVTGLREAVPFYAGTNSDYPYMRQTQTSRKDQVDMTREPGEQSLQGWWYRSQSSYDLGAGIKFMDPVQDPLLARRFRDSFGINVMEPGQVTLLRKCKRQDLTGDTSIDPQRHYMIPYAANVISNGTSQLENGVVVTNGTNMKVVNELGNVFPVTLTGFSGTIVDLSSDGGAYFASSTAGIWRGTLPGNAGTKMASFPTSYVSNGQTVSFTADSQRVKTSYVKERLFVSVNEYLWQIPTQPSTLQNLVIADKTSGSNIAHFYKHPQNGWKWSGFAEGPTLVYAAGYSGDHSAIYGIRGDTSGSSQTFTSTYTPYLIAELPRGEIVLSMISYMGTYLILGTNLGVRVAIIDGSGNLQMGGLTVESDRPVTALMARGNFVWAAGSKSGEGNSFHDGLYRIDLSKNSMDNSVMFPWQRDIYAAKEVGYTGYTGNNIQSIASIGYTDRVAFTIDSVGLFLEQPQELVSTGWLDTGRIRFDTSEDKIFQYLRTNNLPVGGVIKVYWKAEDDAIHGDPLAKWVAGPVAPGSDITQFQGATTSSQGVRVVDMEGSDSNPHPWVSYRFELNARDLYTSPILTGYQVKAQPANVRQRAIRLTLMCFQKERALSGPPVERSVWDRIRKLEIAEELGATVRFQDLGTGEERYCLIDDIKFIAEVIPESRAAKANPGGVLIVTLRSINPPGAYPSDTRVQTL